MKIKRITATVATLVLSAVLASVAAAPLMAQDWPMFGQDLTNSATASQTSLTTGNVGKLAPKWVFTTGGDVSARAAVVNGVAYFPDWGGNLWAVNTSNGAAVWHHQLSDYVGGTSGSVHSRSTPAINGGYLYIGTQEGARLLAINASTGTLVWKTQLETDPYAILSTSPVVNGGVVYEGIASIAEAASIFGIDLSGSTARGSVVAVNAGTGAIQWKTYTAPSGYIGVGVWGSSPVVDASRNTLYIGTGDNYAHPTDPTYLACVGAGGTEASCLASNDYVDSILALDMSTGAVKWAKRLVTWQQQQYGVTDGSDDWNVDCSFGGPQCPSNPGPDYDFGSAPNEITYNAPHGHKTIIGAGQKSGIYYALDPDTGAVLWQTQVGPGSSLGGMEWGSATDGDRIYVAIANLYGIPSAAGSAGSFAALNPATGAILWQVPDPNGSIDIGALAVAKGIVYGSSMASSPTAPTMLALDASNGSILWSYAAGSSVNAGATISGDSVYWGSGYAHLGIPGFTGNNKFYAFSRNGN